VGTRPTLAQRRRVPAAAPTHIVEPISIGWQYLPGGAGRSGLRRPDVLGVYVEAIRAIAGRASDQQAFESSGRRARDKLRLAPSRRDRGWPCHSKTSCGTSTDSCAGWAGYFRYGNSARAFVQIRSHAINRLVLFVANATSSTATTAGRWSSTCHRITWG